MGYYCTVPQCTSLAGKTKNVKFHRFPRDVTMADKWNVILKRGKPYTKYSKVCSLHFTQSDYNVTTMGQWKTLSKDAVPSQNLPKLNPDGSVMVIRKSRTMKYNKTKKDDILGEKSENAKWSPASVMGQAINPSDPLETQENTLAFRLQSLNTIANTVAPQQVTNQPRQDLPQPRPKKQDAFMQTDPILSEDDDTPQPNHSYSETSDNSYNNEQVDYDQYPKSQESFEEKNFEPKDYTKPAEDYIPQTTEEYNKEAEKYALERKSHNGYEKPIEQYPKPVSLDYEKISDVYAFTDKEYQRDGYGYQNGYQDSVEILRNQQHNLQMLQEQHRVNENQNFFNENHIKQEIDINNEEDKFLYERTKEQLGTNSMYGDGQRRVMQQQRLLEHLQQQVKQEPDLNGGCETVMQPQNSPYFPQNGQNVTGGYYEQISRPGPELLIAKQNALAAHTQLWQNTMKRPFFYSDSPHYNGPQLLHRYEDVTRILQ